MGARERRGNVAQPVAQLGDAVQQDEDADGEAEDELAEVLRPAHQRYFTVQP
jgi:hypothetical protein